MKKLFFLFSLISFFITCTQSNLSGTNDETVIRTGAIVYEPGGKKPAVGATVKIFKVSAVDGQFVSKQTTDTAGRYSIEGIPTGDYNIWAEKDSNVTFQDSAFISGSRSTVQNDTLECPSSFTGVVGLQPNHDPRTVTVQVVGTDKFFNNTDVNGRFTMTGMAGGKYSLLLKSTLPSYTPTTALVTVRPCSNDTLNDTLRLIYTGIPAVVGLTVSYDTLNGLVHLSWGKTDYANLQKYMVFRDSYDAIDLSIDPIAARTDTFFIDTVFKKNLPNGNFSFSDSNDYHFSYRVAIRNNSGEQGLTYKDIDIVAAAPGKVKTSFTFTIFHIAKKFKTDSASINDSLLYAVQLVNPTRNLSRVTWVDLSGSATIRTRVLDSTSKNALDTVRYIWSQLGAKSLECRVADAAGTEWRDTATVDIVKDPPVVNLTTPDSEYAFNDTIPLHAKATDRFGSIVKIEWDFGNTGDFSIGKAVDTFVIAPKTEIPNYLTVVRVTDDDGNTAADTVSWSVNMFAPATRSAAFLSGIFTSSLVFDNKMWVIGGSGTSNDVWYSSNGITWIQATPHAEFSPRVAQTSLVFDNKMWVIGGYTINNYTHVFLNDVWYSSDGITWIQATANAGFSPRDSHQSLVFDNKMWVIGGHTSNAYVTNDVWYSSDGITWTQATANADFSPRQANTSLVYDNKMWVIGGVDFVGYENDVWYSSDGIKWTQATASAAFSSQRWGLTSLAYDNKMWVFGGYEVDMGTYYNDIWQSTDGINWTKAADESCFARVGNTSVVYDNRMWIIGGGDRYDVTADSSVWRSGDLTK